MFCMKCGLELPDDSKFCRKCGFAFPITNPQQSDPSTPLPESQPPATAPISPTASAQSTFNFGTFVFAGFSALSLLVCLVKGVVPIYLVEAALWAALAWFWHKRGPFSQGANAAVLLLAVVVALGQGFFIGRQPAPSPTDPQRRNFQVGNPIKSRDFDHVDALLDLGPRKLILGCGTPISDRRLVAAGNGLVGRELGFKARDGSTITILFVKTRDNANEHDDKTWGFNDASNGERQYHISNKGDLDELFSQLPCIPE